MDMRMIIKDYFSRHTVIYSLSFAAKTALADTVIGEQLVMQCGQHKIVLTCGHSEDIANRQKAGRHKVPVSLCNDNTVEFISKTGTSKRFGTYINGEYKDSTPIRLFCRVPERGEKFQIAVLTENPAEFLRFITGFSEDGTLLFDEKSNHLTPRGHGYFYEMSGEAGYFYEYLKNRPKSGLIEIQKAN